MELTLEEYLKSTQTIQSNEQIIIRQAERLTENCVRPEEKAVRLFNFVRDDIQYNMYMTSVYIDDYKASRILELKKGYCVQKAVLLTALGRAVQIPSRLVFAKIKNHRVPEHIIKKLGSNIFPRHGYNQLFLNGKWVNLAATFDRTTCKRNGLPMVEFDGVNDAILPEKDFNGNPYIEYIKKYKTCADLPMDWVRKKIAERFGPDKEPCIKKKGSSG